MFPTQANPILVAFLPYASHPFCRRRSFVAGPPRRCYQARNLPSMPRTFMQFSRGDSAEFFSIQRSANSASGGAWDQVPTRRRSDDALSAMSRLVGGFDPELLSQRVHIVRFSGLRDDRIVITGIGLSTAVGGDREAVWQAMQAGTSGVRRLTGIPGIPDGMLLGATVDDRRRLPRPAQKHSALAARRRPKRSPTAASISRKSTATASAARSAPTWATPTTSSSGSGVTT